MENNNSAQSCGCKVGRMAAAYGVENMDSRLEELYVTDSNSLRDLTDYFNQQLVRATLNKNDPDLIGDAELIYVALTSDDVSADRRAQIRDQLTFADVNVDHLTDDFVSHQTIRSHLQDCLGVDTSRRGITNTADAHGVISWARERDSEIIERVLDRLDRIEEIELGNYEVSHSIRIICYDCGTTYRPSELLDQGHCECQTVTDDQQSGSER